MPSAAAPSASSTATARATRFTRAARDAPWRGGASEIRRRRGTRIHVARDLLARLRAGRLLGELLLRVADEDRVDLAATLLDRVLLVLVEVGEALVALE